MPANFKSTVKRGNNSGTGFAKLQQHQFKLGEKVKVSFMVDNAPKLFFAKIVKMDGADGIYIPSSLSKKYSLIGKGINLEVKRISGFGTTAGDDGRIYVPCEDGENLFLETGDIVLADIACDGSSQARLLKIIKRKRKNVTEFMAILGRKYSNKQVQIQIQRKLEKMIARKSENIDLQKTFGNALSKVNEEELAIFDGKKKPIIVPTHISYDEIALYLGAYFADGTKKGNSWGICASTPEQANFYLKMHRHLVKDPTLTFEISFTLMRNRLGPKELIKKWQDATGLDLSKAKVRMRESISGSATKYNELGTLVVREHKQAVLKFYNALLSSLIRHILAAKNKELAIDFICGVLEGDGTVNAKKRAHVQIATNQEDCPILEKVLKVSKMRFKSVREQGDKFYLRIGALEILRNLPLLKDKIFIFYPKRRKRLFSRLAGIGGVKFLMGQQPSAASWVKSSLRKMGMLDRSYKLTNLGEKIRSDLFICTQDADSMSIE